MKIFKILIGLMAALLLSACSSYQYYAIQSNNLSFSKYHTFAWLPPADTVNNKKISDIADDRIHESITKVLEGKGLRLRAQRPDLLVRYGVDVKERVKLFDEARYIYDFHQAYSGVLRYHDRRDFYYYYSSPLPVYVGSDIVNVPYQQGTLIIDLIERKTGKVIWRGYAVGEVDDPEKTVKDIPEVVNGILNRLHLQPM